MVEINRFFLSIMLGTALGAIGVILTGIVAAIAIPAEFFNWFHEHATTELAPHIMYFFTILTGYGLIALIVGYALGKSDYWLSNSVISYLAMISYIAILDWGNPFQGLTISSALFGLVPLACLIIAAHRSNNKYNEKQVNLKGY